MQIHQLSKPKHLKTSRRVGRGGKRGTYSGRGVKGQKSRAGHKIRPAIRDYILRFPKLRGMTRKSNVSPYGSAQKTKTPIFTVTVSQLERVFTQGASVSPQSLVRKNVVKRYKGRMPKVKILSNGDLKKPLTVKGVECSEQARVKIEQAGGTVQSNE